MYGQFPPWMMGMYPPASKEAETVYKIVEKLRRREERKKLQDEIEKKKKEVPKQKVWSTLDICILLVAASPFVGPPIALAMLSVAVKYAAMLQPFMK